MAITLKNLDRESWQRLAPSFLDYNYRHLWDFGTACADRLGAVSEHIAVYEGNELMGLADVRIKRIPFFKAGIAYINGGPLVRCGDVQVEYDERLKIALAELVKVYVQQKKYVLRVQPVLGDETWNSHLDKTFAGLGFVINKTLRPYRTIVTDISGSLEDIRKQLNQKWRNCLNNSEKRGLTVKSGTNEEFFSVFCNLYKALINRKDFDVDLTPDFYRQVQGSLSEHERFVVSIVYENDRPVAGHVASILGDMCVYLLGATNEAGLQCRAAYLAQWHVIQMARERGCRYYDLGGIDPDNNPGVYHFKKGMGGVDTTVPGPFEYYPGRLKKTLVLRGEQMYRYLKRFMMR